MFTKCANWNCSQPFRYSHGAVVFRVETVAGISSLAAPSVCSQVDYHWLCAECLRVILISLEDHGIGTQTAPEMGSGGLAKIVRLTSLDAALAELAKTTEGTQTLEKARTVERAETMDRTQARDRTQTLERTNPESHPKMSGFEEALSSGGGSPQA